MPPNIPPSSLPALSSRPPRPGMGRTNSFQKKLVTSGPTPPSLLHSPYIESPQSIFNRGRYDPTHLTPPNEHDKLCLMDTVPIGAKGTSNGRPGMEGAGQYRSGNGMVGGSNSGQENAQENRYSKADPSSSPRYYGQGDAKPVRQPLKRSQS